MAPESASLRERTTGIGAQQAFSACSRRVSDAPIAEIRKSRSGLLPSEAISLFTGFGQKRDPSPETVEMIWRLLGLLRGS